MKAVHNRWSDLLNDCIQIALVCGTIGIALKFITFFNQWVYFPTFPNLLDSTFLIISIVYFAWKARKHNPQRTEKQVTFNPSKPLAQKAELEH
jgi:hypothetical protein